MARKGGEYPEHAPNFFHSFQSQFCGQYVAIVSAGSVIGQENVQHPLDVLQLPLPRSSILPFFEMAVCITFA